MEIDDKGAREIAERSRGTPRIVNRLLRRVRDYAHRRIRWTDHLGSSQEFLDRMNVDTYGLDEMDQKLLRTIIENFKGGPVGLGTISASIHEERDSIEEIIEPYSNSNRLAGSYSPRTQGNSQSHQALQAISSPTPDPPPATLSFSILSEEFATVLSHLEARLLNCQCGRLSSFSRQTFGVRNAGPWRSIISHSLHQFPRE